MVMVMVDFDGDVRVGDRSLGDEGSVRYRRRLTARRRQVDKRAEEEGEEEGGEREC